MPPTIPAKTISEFHRKNRFMLLGWLILFVVAIFLAKIAFSIEDWSRDWTSNQARFDPNANDPLLRPVAVPLSVDETKRRITAWVASQSDWELVSGDAAFDRMHLVHRTTWLRFADDVTLTLVATDEKMTRVQAESRSRVGKGDLGQNPRNLRLLHQGLLSLIDGS